MPDRKNDLYRALGTASTLGLSIAIAIGIGLFIGTQLDAWFGTRYFFYIFLFIGIAAGFRNIFIIGKRELKRDDRDENGS